MAASALCMSLMHASIRHLSGGVHPIELVFFRYLFGIFFMLPWLVRVGKSGLKASRHHLYLLRALTSVFATFMFFSALGMIPLADATATLFTRPLFAALIAILFLGEAGKLGRWGALLAGFAGVLVMVRPGFSDVNLGIFLAFGAAAAAAVNPAVIRSLTRTESPDTITFYASIWAAGLAVLPAVFFWSWPTGEQYVWLLAMAGLGTLGQRALARSLAIGEVSLVLPFEYTRLPFAALIGWLMFTEVPVIWTWVGGTLIFGGAIWLARVEARETAQRAASAV